MNDQKVPFVIFSLIVILCTLNFATAYAGTIPAQNTAGGPEQARGQYLATAALALNEANAFVVYLVHAASDVAERFAAITNTFLLFPDHVFTIKPVARERAKTSVPPSNTASNIPDAPLPPIASSTLVASTVTKDSQVAAGAEIAKINTVAAAQKTITSPPPPLPRTESVTRTPVIQQTIVQNGISKKELESRLKALEQKIIAEVSLAGLGTQQYQELLSMISKSQRIDSLSGVTITNSTINNTTVNNVTGGSTPGGSDTYVQFNDSGALGASANFTFGKNGNLLTVTNASTSNLTASNFWVIGQGAGCAQFDANGKLTANALPCSSGGGGGGSGWTFIAGAILNSTTTDQVLVDEVSTTTNAKLEVNGLSAFKSGFVSQASSTITSGLFSMSGGASTTNITASGTGYFNIASTTSLNLGFNSTLLSTNGAGAVQSTLFSGPLSLSGATLSISQANSGTNGYLVSGDWSNFNNKISSSSLMATYPLQYSSGTGVFSIAFGTTTANNWQQLQTLLSGLIVQGSSTVAGQFNATQASTTQLTVSGTAYLGTASTSNLTVSNIQNALLVTSATGIVSGTSTLAVNFGGTGSTTLGGLLAGAGGSITSATISSPLTFLANALGCQAASGSQAGCLSSTDWSTFNGKLNYGNIWTTATTFGTTTRATTTPEWFQTAFFASSTASAPSVIDNFTSSKSTTTAATTTSLGFTNLTSAILSTNASGGVVATTSIGCNYISGGLGCASSAASSTLLGDNNIFSGTTTFSGKTIFNASSTFTSVINIQNASSSLVTLGTAWFSTITNALLSTDPNGKVVSTSTPTANNFIATSQTAASILPYASSTAHTLNNTTAASTTALYVANLQSGTTTLTRMSFLTNDLSGATTTASIASILQQNFNGGKGDLTFSTLNSGTLTEGARLTSAGFFGIGTSTPGSTLSVGGGAYISGTLSISQLSILFGGATTTNFTASGEGYFGTASTSNLFLSGTNNALLVTNGQGQVSGTSTLSVSFGGTGSTTLGGLLAGAGGSITSATFSGPLSWTNNALTISQANGSTNGYLTSTDWNTFNGKLNYGNIWTTATTFGTTTRATTTPEWFQTAFFASSTASAPSVIDNLVVAQNATTTAATTTSLGFTNLKNAILSTNNSGGVVATTSIGCNYISGGLGCATSVASSTLLGDRNTWTGLQTFNGGATTTGLTANNTTAASTTALYVANLQSGTTTLTRMAFLTNDISGATTTAAISSILQKNFNGGNGDLTFSVLNTGTLTEAARITSNGYVGIGTTTPVSLLHVAGTQASLSGSGTISSAGTTITGVSTSFTTQLNVGDIIIASGQSKVIFSITNDTTLKVDSSFAPNVSGASFTYTPAVARFVSQSGTQKYIINNSGFTINSSVPALKLQDVQASGHIYDIGSGKVAAGVFSIADLTQGTQPFNIDASGNVGIGTTTPNAKLSIFAALGDTNLNLFNIASSTGSATTTLFQVSNTGSTTIAGVLNVGGTNATSTFGSGLSINSGCFAIGSTCLPMLGTTNTWTALQTFQQGIISQASSTIGNGTPTGGLTIYGTATTTNLSFASLTSALLATDQTGHVIATTTIGTNFLSANSITINSAGELSGGATVALGGTITLNASTSPSVGAIYATSSIASQLPYASSTVHTVNNTTAASTTALYVANLQSGTTTLTRMAFLTNDISGATTTASIASILQKNFNGGNGDLTFSTLQNGTLTEAGRFTSNGFLGIGTTTPGSILSIGVAGNAQGINLGLATSTFTGGIKAACFSTDGINCLSSNATLSGGTAGMLTAWTSATALTATGTPTAASYFATSSTATSTFLGGFQAGSATNNFSIFNNGSFNLTRATGAVGDTFGYINGTSFLVATSSIGAVNPGDIAFGFNAFISNTTGNNDLAVGTNALKLNTTGSLNTAVGQNAMTSNTGGQENTAVGTGAAQNSNGNFNTAIGSGAFSVATGTSDNTAVGRQALQGSTVGNLTVTGANNVAVGENALQKYITISNSVAVGNSALQNASTTASDNTALGYLAMQGNTPGTITGTQNVAVGENALQNFITAGSNVAMGYGAMQNATSTSNSVAIGYNALQNASNDGGGGGAYNTAVGYSTLAANTYGARNVAVGYAALLSNTIGSLNTAVGMQALSSNISGGQNTAVGLNSMQTNSAGGNNTVVGYNTMSSATSSSNNTIMGWQAGVSISGATGVAGSSNSLFGLRAGQDITTGSSNLILETDSGNGLGITTGSSNILLGNDVRAGLNQTGSSQLNIGNLIFGTSVAGGATFSTGKVGIGTSSPNYTLTSANGTGPQLSLADGSLTNNSWTMRAAGNNFYIATSTYSATSSVAALSIDTNGKVTANCFTNDGSTCITSGSVSGGTAGMLTSWVTGSTLTATSGPTAGWFVATSSIATSTFAGGVVHGSATNNFTINNLGSFNMTKAAGVGDTFGYLNGTSFLVASSATAVGNLGIGLQTLSSITTGYANTAFGYQTLQNATTSYRNVAIGYQSLVGTAGASVADVMAQNTAVGVSALQFNLSGDDNVGIGFSALQNATSTNQNTAVGSGALSGNSTNSQFTLDTAVGYNALNGESTGGSNTAVGSNALKVNTTGGTNAAFGNSALTNNTAGGLNVAIGASAMSANITGTNNTGVGYQVMSNATSTTDNTAVGLWSMQGNSSFYITGASNVAVGRESLKNFTSGGSNAVLGYQAMMNATNTSQNVAVGYQALKGNATNFTGSQNTALGYESLQNVTTGGSNTGLGYLSLQNETSGGGNTSLGWQAMRSALSGDYNAAFGLNALTNATTSDHNLAIGPFALNGNNPNNVTISGSYNTGVGLSALYNYTAGNYNTALGVDSGYSLTSGSSNITIGSFVDVPNPTGNQQLNIGNVLYGSNLYNSGSVVSSSPTQNGNIGIGTSSPYAKLSLSLNNGDTDQTAFVIASSTASATTTLFSVSATGAITQGGGATSTFSNGINFTGGCVTLNGGACIGGGATLSGGVAGMLAGWTSASTIAPTSTPTVANIIATSSVASILPYASSTAYTINNTSSATTTGLFLANLQSGTTTSARMAFLTNDVSGAATTTAMLSSILQKNFAGGNADLVFSTLQSGALTEAARFNSTGNFGLGTTSPNSDLTIQGGASGDMFDIETSGGSSVMHVTNAGNVGVGTTSAGSLFSIGGIVNFSTATTTFYGTNGNGINLTSGCFAINNTCVGGGGGSNPGGTGTELQYRSGASSFGAITSSAFNSTTGNVGFGTTTPWAKLSLSLNSNDPINQYAFLIASSTATATTTLFSVDRTGLTSIGDSSGTGDATLQFAADANAWAVGYASSTKAFQIASSTALGGSNIYMSILKNGRVGFGTSSPMASLSVTSNGATASTSYMMYVSTGVSSSTPAFAVASPNENGRVYINATTTNPFGTGANSASSTLMLVVGNGTSGKGNVASFISNTGVCYINPTNTALSCSSDIRLKKNITSVSASTSALRSILSLDPVMYNWNKETDGSAKHGGFIAQDVEQIFPDLIQTDDSGMKSMNYAGLTPYLAAAIKELDLQVAPLTSATTSAGELLASTSSVATTTPWIGSFATSSETIKSPIAGLLDSVIHVFKDVVYAATGIFDKVIAKDLYAVNVFADEVHAKEKLCVGSVCVTESQFLQMTQAAGAATSQSGVATSGNQNSTPSQPTASSSPSGDTLVANNSTSTDTTAPVITINGNNPANIDVGQTYADLGATVTDNVDHNLGIHTWVDGVFADVVQLDTSVAATHHIDYVATDNAGNTATSTRTVNVNAIITTTSSSSTTTTTDASSTPSTP